MVRHMLVRTLFAGVAFVATGLAGSAAIGAENVLVRVNDIEITEKDLKLAASEIGPQLSTIPASERQQVLVEYLIENTLLATAAKMEKLGDVEGFDERITYYRQRALRDAYFDKNVMNAVTEADARKTFELQFGVQKPEEEVRARHILVKTEPDARDIIERLARGDAFEVLAKELSQGPSKVNGGDLGYFTQGQMVKPFEDAIFAMKKGEISEPVKTQFGWHVIKLEDRRTRKPPEFGPLKDQIMASLIQQKARDVIDKLRTGAKIEFTSKELEAAVEEARRGSFGGFDQ